MTTLMSGLARPLVQSRCLLNARAIVVPCRLSACGIEKADNLIRLLTWIRRVRPLPRSRRIGGKQAV